MIDIFSISCEIAPTLVLENFIDNKSALVSHYLSQSWSRSVTDLSQSFIHIPMLTYQLQAIVQYIANPPQSFVHTPKLSYQ